MRHGERGHSSGYSSARAAPLDGRDERTRMRWMFRPPKEIPLGFRIQPPSILMGDTSDLISQLRARISWTLGEHPILTHRLGVAHDQ